MRHAGGLLVFVALLAPWVVSAQEGRGRIAGVAAGAARCSSDASCDDGRYCNGAERCNPGAARADARGCVAHDLRGLESVCAPERVCREAARECGETVECSGSSGDQDGDGHTSRYCGGDDCNDTDPRRYPGNAEVCDPEGRDEDCNPSTPGSRDADGDGYIDAACFNYSR